MYTHAEFDGHPDHATVARAVTAALARSGLAVVLHATLIHPAGSGPCLGWSAERWPNPPLAGDPFARFTPTLDVTPPPVPSCGPTVEGFDWGPAGPPDELVEVPLAMQEVDPARNLKWQAITRYASQIDCRRDEAGHRHPSCGYMRAFVKRREFFWTRRLGDAARRAVDGPVLVIGAHPDDEALAAAGVLAHARATGRRAFAAVVTTGDLWTRPPATSE